MNLAIMDNLVAEPLVVCSASAEHDDIEPTSQCCGGTNFYGFCSKCHEHTGWVRYCEVCDTEFPAEVNEARP